MDTSEFKEVFAAEARDYLQQLNEDLLELEDSPQDRAILDEMFRAAHSLKGMAGTMGYEQLAGFTHKMEGVLHLLRTGELTASKPIINALFESIDALEILLDQAVLDEASEAPPETARLLQDILDKGVGFSDQEDTEEPDGDRMEPTQQVQLDEYDLETIEQAAAQGYQAVQLDIALRANTLLKSVRVFTVFQALEGVGTVIKSVPSAQDLEEERFDREFSIVLLTQEPVEQIELIVQGISEIDRVQTHVLSLDEAFLKEGSPSKPDTATPTQTDSSESSSDLYRRQLSSSTQSRGVFADKYVRVETDRLDKLINLVGELVISRTQVLEIGRTIGQSDAQSTIVQIDRITTDLQYAAMNLRMVPIKQVFDRFPRMVRDLAEGCGKEIRLELFGADTELDRSIVNQISDPLVHLIRNSVDHGIEGKDVRQAAGKPSFGTIRLGARHEGSHVFIEISDDGQGINVDRIREKAIDKGLLRQGYDETLSVKEAMALLFEPGFSTSDTVTDVSGRGVGMDAVKATVEALSGVVEMDSTPGQGSRVSIKLPLTLAIIKALLVEVQGDTYAIPIQAVKENLLVSPEQIKSVQQNKVIMLRNEVLPLVDLAASLGFPVPQYEGDLEVIVVESQGEKVGFVVEDLIGQQEIVIKSLSELLGDIPGIAGATVLGNGRVALILDNSTLVKEGA